MNRAYSVIDFRAVDEEKRIIEGIASTPQIDSYNSVLEPMGAKFHLPMPFLRQHNSHEPIGHVIEVNPTKDGIRIRAQIQRSPKPGVLDYLEDAWYQIKLGLVRGLSVGFNAIEGKDTFDKKFGGIRYLEWNWLELSAVTIAANSDASVTSVRSADEAVLALLGTRERQSVVRLNSNPPVSGLSSKEKAMSKIQEHIAALKTKRDANDAELDAILDKVQKENRSRDAEEQLRYDGLTRDNESLERDIKDFEARERSMVARASVVESAASGKDPEKTGQEQRSGQQRPVIEGIRSMAPKGIGVARMAIAVANGMMSYQNPIEIAKRRWPDAPEVALAIRAVVEAGDTTTSGWASQLVPAAQQMQDEFLELLRPATIIGKLPLNKVPFNIAVPIETASGTAQWVGEGAPKPVTKLTLSNVTLTWAKAAAIVAITEELAKFSQPDAELVVRNSMVKTLVRFFDSHFISATAAVSGVSPAGILNGISSTATTGTSAAAFRTDMSTLLNKMTVNNVPLTDIWLLMSSTQAVNLSLLVTDLGVPLFPSITRDGGSILGFPVVISEAVGTKIIALNANEILLASDPGVSVATSREATIEMSDAPAGGETSPTSDISTLKSAFQNNLIFIRVEQFITWKVGRTSAVEYLTSTAYKA